MLQLIMVCCLAALAGCVNVHVRDTPVETVANLDLDRYLGKWYEIGRLPNRFQKGCVASSATYSRIDAQTIAVLNECREGRLDGEPRRAQGTAWLAGDGSNPAKLEVQFFWPFRGDYWVIALDTEYRWAMIGHPQRKYLWILSREPDMPDVLYRRLLQQAASQGFDVSAVQRTLQPGA